ncbi:MAG: MFS transporter [Gammaproteobacteria bacterium]|nr:MFS transporter [Gammaproteobacteria bacterium]
MDVAATEGSDSGYPSRGYAWTVVAILIGTAIVSYTDRQVLSLLVDPIRRDLSIGDTRMSLLLGTAFAVVYGVAGLPLGWLADRVSRRNLIVAGIAVWSLGTIACGLSRNFDELFASRVFVGLGEAVLSPAAISLISDYFPPSRRGTAVGAFLSGIAIGIGASILIGGGVLQAVEAGVFASTPLATLAAWRLVLILIGVPGLLWTAAIFVIREPARRGAASTAGAGAVGGPRDRPVDRRRLRLVAPIYVVVAAASLVDNAVGAWAPTLLIREFHRDAARVGVQLGLYLTIAFGVGVLLGGWLADRAAARGGLSRKLGVCILAATGILPIAALIASPRFPVVMAAVPSYFALSGIVTAAGFSAILDLVPAQSRGLAMAISFFLNVAIGAGLGPTAVAVTAARVHGAASGLAAGLSLTAAGGYGLALASAALGWVLVSRRTQ